MQALGRTVPIHKYVLNTLLQGSAFSQQKGEPDLESFPNIGITRIHE